MAGQLDSFAERVISDLWTAFDIFFPAEQEQEDADADGGRPRMTSELAIERNFHETFGLSITRRFCGRDDELQAMTAYADAFEAGRSTSLVVHGPSGAGRSALLAKFALSYQRLRPGAVVLPVFVGASPSSRSLLNVLRFVCDQLFIAFPEAVGPVMPPAHCSAAELRQHFVDVLTNASYSQKRVVLVLDAIERLDDSGAEQPFALEWLPVAPPICVVLSTTTSHCTASALAGRSRQASVCLRPLSMQHRASVVRAFFADYRKKLDESPSNNQMNLLLRKEHSSLPLWLTVACEELRIFGVFERLNDAINQLPGTVPQLLQQTLARLETQHGVALLSRALSFIACCRGGITESDLLRLLAPPGRYALSPVVWNEVFRSLELVFLNPPGAADERYLSLSHQQAYTAIADRYMSSLSARTAPHRELADYYQSLADPLGNRSWQGTATRAFQQLSYHYTYAEMKTELSELLADPVFLAARTLQGQVFELLSDFSLALGYLESDRLPPTFSSSSSSSSSFSLSSSSS
ncbi:MAG: ATP-binding protein, partial [Microbacteriaceae bacterium]|nr:ATP-binding protein [Microbacteriaceae bacterium]